MNCKAGRRENQWTVSHRMAGTPEYRAWQGMRYRCERPQDKSYADYGGRGISVCERWQSFEAFMIDMGPRPAGSSINRRDNDAGYTPENCHWATVLEQNRNRRNSLKVDVQGEILPLVVACQRFGIDYYKAHRRLKRLGWSVQRTFGIEVTTNRTIDEGVTA